MCKCSWPDQWHLGQKGPTARCAQAHKFRSWSDNTQSLKGSTVGVVNPSQELTDWGSASLWGICSEVHMIFRVGDSQPHLYQGTYYGHTSVEARRRVDPVRAQGFSDFPTLRLQPSQREEKTECKCNKHTPDTRNRRGYFPPTGKLPCSRT